MSSFLQLPLDFPEKISYDVDEFYVSDSNALAFKCIDLLPSWQTFATFIFGEKASGKSHLCALAMQKEVDAISISAKNLDFLFRPAQKLVIVEDIQFVNQEALFHLFNFQKEKGFLLLTADKSLKNLQLSLRDLESRLLTVPAVEILPPDDELIVALILKYFKDLNVEISEDVLFFILKNIERSYEYLQNLIKNIDFLSRSAKRKITIPLIKDAMAFLG